MSDFSCSANSVAFAMSRSLARPFPFTSLFGLAGSSLTGTGLLVGLPCSRREGLGGRRRLSWTCGAGRGTAEVEATGAPVLNRNPAGLPMDENCSLGGTAVDKLAFVGPTRGFWCWSSWAADMGDSDGAMAVGTAQPAPHAGF